MHQYSVLLELMLALVVLVATIRSGSCTADRVVTADDQHQLLSVSDDNFGDMSQQRGSETFTELVGGEGYDVEEHEVTTEDDYILSIHRIPGSPSSPVAHGKQPVLLMHGLFAASDIWVLRGAKHDLAYLLADNGFDVWALNSRGNYYGKRHKHLTTKDPAFWRFSWHEFGTYDAAASMDYILSVTGMPKVSLVGHSMGSTMEMVLLSQRPEYNDKVNVALTFAPVAIFTHTFPGFVPMIGIRYAKKIEEALKLLGVFELFPRNAFDLSYYVGFCQQPTVELICKRIVGFLSGITNLEAFPMSLLPRAIRHYPSGTSVDTLMHYAQIISSGKFKQYDFGPRTNYLRYKSFAPPEYPLENITAPLVLYYGPNDSYTTKMDVQAVLKKIPSASSREIPYSKFGHLDFLFLNETKRLLYDDTVELLNGYRDLEANGLDSNNPSGS